MLLGGRSKTHDRLYLVMSYDQGYESNIKEYSDVHLERLGEQPFSPGLKVYVYRRFDARPVRTN